MTFYLCRCAIKSCQIVDVESTVEQDRSLALVAIWLSMQSPIPVHHHVHTWVLRRSRLLSD